MRGRTTVGRRVSEISARPARIVRAFLAEDYDGIGQVVKVQMSLGGVTNAINARVAAGDFGGGRIFPVGTLVTAIVYHGHIEVLLGNLPPPPDPLVIIQQVSGTSTLVMPNPITFGSTLILSITNIAPGAGFFEYTVHGYTLGPLAVPGGGLGTLFKRVETSESQTLGMGGNVRGTWYEVSGPCIPGTYDANSRVTDTGNGIVMTAGPITVAEGSIAFAIGTIGQGGAFNSAQNTLTFTPGPGMIEDLDARLTPNLWTGHAFPSAGSFTAQTTNSANVPVPNTPGFLYDVDVPWTMHVVEFIRGT